MKIIFPEYTYNPKEILTGFNNFCTQYAFEHEIINDIRDENITDGTISSDFKKMGEKAAEMILNTQPLS